MKTIEFFFLLFENSFNDSSLFFLLCFLENEALDGQILLYLLPTFPSTMTSYRSFTRIDNYPCSSIFDKFSSSIFSETKQENEKILFYLIFSSFHKSRRARFYVLFACI